VQKISYIADSWIIDSGFDLMRLTALTKCDLEVIKIEYNADYLKRMFLKNKRKFKKKLKIKHI
jgi:hypothetical protein